MMSAANTYYGTLVLGKNFERVCVAVMCSLHNSGVAVSFYFTDAFSLVVRVSCFLESEMRHHLHDHARDALFALGGGTYLLGYDVHQTRSADAPPARVLSQLAFKLSTKSAFSS